MFKYIINGNLRLDEPLYTFRRKVKLTFVSFQFRNISVKYINRRCVKALKIIKLDLYR